MSEEKTLRTSDAATAFGKVKPGDAAWQRQLRDRFLAEGTPPVDLDLRKAVVRPISRSLAEQVILKYEWLGTMGTARLYYGLFFGPYLAGATCVAVGNGTAGRNTHVQYGIEARELATLVRGACVHWAPVGANSKLVSWTVRLLRADSAAKLVVAYADTEAGEIGTIYQACGWTYLGPSASIPELVSPKGHVYNNRFLTQWGRHKGKALRTPAEMRGLLLDRGWRVQPGNRKHRYCVVVDRGDAALVARIAERALPYPKRTGLRSTGSGASGVQPEGEAAELSAGSTPR